jgi:hypothetical protein
MLEFHKHTNEDGEVLILRRIPQNRITKNGFTWPSGVGTSVECPDWNPEPRCGGGLHGWPWGFGLGDGCDYDIIGDIWLVVGAKPEDVVGELDKGAKCKFRKGIIRHEGSFADAMDAVRSGFGECVRQSAEKGDGNDSKAATAGNYSKAATAGNYSKAAAAGNGSKAATAGDDSKAAAAGYGSKAATAGYGSKAATAGNYSKAAAAGNDSKAAAAGYYSKAATAGYGSKAATAGDDSKAEAAGRNTLACAAGDSGAVKVGERGAFAIAYWDERDGWRFLCGKVGENGIKADTWYHVKNGELVEAE